MSTEGCFIKADGTLTDEGFFDEFEENVDPQFEKKEQLYCYNLAIENGSTKQSASRCFLDGVPPEQFMSTDYVMPKFRSMKHDNER